LITGGSLCIDFPCINADGVASGSSSVPDGGATAKLPTDHHSADAAAADEKLTMKKAIIVGGSMAGLLAGNILIRQGWHVEVLERTREGLEARGAGIVPQRSLLAALKRAGVTVRADIGIRITKRVAYDRAGNGLCDALLRPIQHVVVLALQPPPRRIPGGAFSRRAKRYRHRAAQCWRSRHPR
jgi:hypothetical protein